MIADHERGPDKALADKSEGLRATADVKRRLSQDCVAS